MNSQQAIEIILSEAENILKISKTIFPIASFANYPQGGKDDLQNAHESLLAELFTLAKDIAFRSCSVSYRTFDDWTRSEECKVLEAKELAIEKELYQIFKPETKQVVMDVLKEEE